MATSSKIRHLGLLAELLLAEARRAKKRIRLEWAAIDTASIGPDPTVPNGLVLRLSSNAIVGDDDDAALLECLVTHEIVCHGHHTDFDAWPTESLLSSLTNVFEDVRGELLGAQRYPGSRNAIHSGLRVMVKRSIFSEPDNDAHPASLFFSWLITRLRCDVLGQSVLSEIADSCESRMIQLFGHGFLDQVKKLSLPAVTAPDTASVVLIAKAVLDYLSQVVSLPPKPDQVGADSGADSGKASGKGSGTDSSTGGEPTSETEADSQEVTSDPHSTASAGNSDSSHNAPESSDPHALQELVASILGASTEDVGSISGGLEGMIGDSCGSDSLRRGGRRGAQVDHFMVHDDQSQSMSDEERSFIRKGSRAISAHLSVRLEDLLMSRSNRRTRYCEDGKLDARRAGRVLTGSTDVYRKRTQADSLDTAVMLLCDASSSMGSMFASKSAPQLQEVSHGAGKVHQPERAVMLTRHDVSRMVVTAAGDVLNRSEVAFAVASFNEHVTWHKHWHDDWGHGQKHFNPACIMGTNTHFAVPWAASQMLECTESRRVLVVVTDGDPGVELVLLAGVKEAQSLGIDIVFVLIGEADEAKYKSLGLRYGVAHNDKELASAVFDALSAALL